jgi:hypothetical protein
MTRHRRRARHGDGTAWLVADRAHGDFLCHWYVGPSGDHLGERARAATAEDAVAWGRARTTRVRIRTADGCSQWAGSAPQPEGLFRTWSTPTVAPVDRKHALVGEGAPCCDSNGTRCVWATQ